MPNPINLWDPFKTAKNKTRNRSTNTFGRRRRSSPSAPDDSNSQYNRSNDQSRSKKVSNFSGSQPFLSSPSTNLDSNEPSSSDPIQISRGLITSRIDLEQDIRKVLKRQYQRSADEALAKCHNIVANIAIARAAEILDSHLDYESELNDALRSTARESEDRRARLDTAYEIHSRAMYDAKEQFKRDRLEWSGWHDVVVSGKNTELIRARSMYDEQTKKIEKMAIEVANKSQDLNNIRLIADSQADELHRLEQSIGDRDRNISHLTGILSGKDVEINRLQAMITVKDDEIALKANDLMAAREQAKVDLSVLSDSHQQTLDSLNKMYEIEITKQADKHDMAIQRLESELSDTKRQDMEARQRAESEWRMRVASMSDAHEQKLKKTIAEHERNTEKLQSDRKDLNAALLKRDDEQYQGRVLQTYELPRRPDNQIKASFDGIQQSVDALGRLNWRPDCSVWSKELLQELGNRTGPRELKRAILQDSIWTVLMSQVFVSPFRIFGEAGRLLESEWVTYCGNGAQRSEIGFVWPPPGIGAERWRYFTMKGARDILTTGMSEYDPRAELRKGFSASQGELISRLTSTVNQFVDVGDTESQTIQRLSKQAFTIWLDFQMHRCRIVVRPTGSEELTIHEKVSAAQRGSLRLTLQPSVSRYGNVKGLELEHLTTIAGCEGESFSVS